MKGWKLGLISVSVLAAVAFFAIGYYNDSKANALSFAEKEARARWAWVLTSREYLELGEEDETVSEDCGDCDGKGILGDGRVEVECDTCEGTGKGGFQMTILKMPVQASQVECTDGGCTVQGKPIRAAAKRGRMFAGRIIRKIRFRK
ncbi:MAG: hypothetical protein VXX23_05735 [Actinomycetota bacterium]|nr:hypothetical protein [Actinomycetota bacterium]MEC8768069.1 hypothetical protein [Actinomycetota bacterium]